MRDARGVLNRRERRLELRQQQCRGADRAGRTRHIGGREPGIRAAGDRNAVLAIPGDEDERGAGGSGRIAHHMRHIDAVAPQAGKGLVAERVAAEARDQAHPAAGAGRTHGLIRALAARGREEFSPQQGLARTGYARHADDHVGVRAADHHDGFRTRFAAGCRAHQVFEAIERLTEATYDQLGKETGLSESTLRRRIDELDGRVSRIGAGKRNDPFRFITTTSSPTGGEERPSLFDEGNPL